MLSKFKVSLSLSLWFCQKLLNKLNSIITHPFRENVETKFELRGEKIVFFFLSILCLNAIKSIWFTSCFRRKFSECLFFVLRISNFHSPKTSDRIERQWRMEIAKQIKESFWRVYEWSIFSPDSLVLCFGMVLEVKFHGKFSKFLLLRLFSISVHS